MRAEAIVADTNRLISAALKPVGTPRGCHRRAGQRTVRRFVHRLGYRFRLHRCDLPGTPDLVVPKHRVVISVHGCFWHQHDVVVGADNRRRIRSIGVRSSPGTCSAIRETRSALEQLGWRVLTVWERQAKDPGLANRIDQFLRDRSQARVASILRASPFSSLLQTPYLVCRSWMITLCFACDD